MTMTNWCKETFALLVACWLFLTPALGAKRAVAAMAPTNADRARLILSEGLESKDFTVRIEAISAMGMVSRNDILVARLGGFLQDKNVEVRLAAVRTLADLKSPASEDALRKAMETDKVPEVSYAAAKVLAGWQNREAIGVLDKIYEGKQKTKSDMLRQQARSFFSEFHSFPSGMMFIVSKGIGYAPVPGAGEGFSALTQLLKDPGISDRAQVLLILARTKNAASVRLLRGALQDREWSVRAVAAQMIAQTAQMELRDSLPPLLTDKDQRVRLQAAGAYLHLLLVGRKG
jgi:HEAT repeat protein